MIRKVGIVFLFLFQLLYSGWGALALWFDAPNPVLFVCLFVGLHLLLIVTLPGLSLKKRCWLFCLPSVVLCWWLTLRPRNDRNWSADVERLPLAVVEGDQVTLHNVRDFRYREEFDYIPRWENRTFSFSDIEAVDIFLSDWGATGIVHTIMSFTIREQQPIAISIEARKEEGELYSAVLGFFRHFELYYVVGSEQDLIGVRAKHRGEQLTLLQLRTTPDVAQALFRSYIKRINDLNEHPRWYNAFTSNCTNTIRHHAIEAGTGRPWNYRLFANKYLGELLYMRGQVNTTIPYKEIMLRGDMTLAARESADDENFSQIIRGNLPPR